jgi:hypothetical protein
MLQNTQLWMSVFVKFRICVFFNAHSHTHTHYKFTTCPYMYGPGSSVGIATGYGLDGPGSNLGGGEIFHTCPDRPWGPPSLLYSGHRVFPGGRKRPGRDADPSPPSSAEV